MLDSNDNQVSYQKIRNSLESESSFPTQPKELVNNNQKKGAALYCTICCEERVDIYDDNAEPFVCVDDHNHKCCNSCFKAYLLELITTKKPNKLVCPQANCLMELQDNQIYGLLKMDLALKDKIANFRFEC